MSCFVRNKDVEINYYAFILENDEMCEKMSQGRKRMRIELKKM